MSTVNLVGLGMTLQKPIELAEPEENDSGHSLIELEPQNWMYKEIVVDFENAGLQVVKIEQLKNHLQMHKYKNERKYIADRKPQDPAFKLNEKYLYHGTCVQKEAICTEGLDQRLCKGGCFGKGIYFSDYPQKCVKYAEKGNTQPFILLERVILGSSKEYPLGVRDKFLRREPEKELPCKGWRFYDSVIGCPKDHKEYVVYNSARVLIECIITYSSKKDDCLKSNATASHPSESLLPAPSAYSQKPLSSKSSFHVTPSTIRFSSKADDDDDGSDTTDEETNSDSFDSDDDEGHSTDSSLELKDDERENSKFGNNRRSVITPKPVDIIRPDDILAQKKKEFTLKTGESNVHVIESFLVATDLDVDKAISLFFGKDKKRKQMEQEKKKKEAEVFYDAQQDVDREKAEASTFADPVVNPEKWRTLSEEDREAIIESLTDNFLTITSLDDDKENRQLGQKILSSCGYDLDLSIVTFYENGMKF